MNVIVLRPDELDDRHLAEWRRMQRLDPVLESPYLCPEFVQIAAQVCSDVVVAIALEQDRPVAFLPLQRRGKVAVEVGFPLSDCQAIITDRWSGDPRDLLRAAGVSVYNFTHHRASQLSAYHRKPDISPVIDLSDGFDAYVAAQRKRPDGGGIHGRPHSLIPRRRQAERSLGDLRFTMHENDKDALRQVITWKRQQYKETHLLDPFAYGWPVDLLERIHASQSEDFAGVLSTLRSGDKLIAAHMGMRSRTVLHYWFPAYDIDFAKYSPGSLLFLDVCRGAAAAGLREIELGHGQEAFKSASTDRSIPIASGFVGCASLRMGLRHLRDRTEALSRTLPLGRYRFWPEKFLDRLARGSALRTGGR